MAGAAEFEPLHFASARNCLDRTSHEWGRSWRRPVLLSLSAEALGFDDDHSECNVSNPAAPASQSGLHRPTCEDPSKPRGTAEFCGSRLVSVSGIGLEKRHSSAWSPRPFFGVSFLLDPLIGAGDIEERAFIETMRSDRWSG